MTRVIPLEFKAVLKVLEEGVVAGYEAASRSGAIRVAVRADGVPLGVRLGPEVMALAGEELAARILRLFGLAGCRAAGDRGVLAAQQVAAAASAIDF